MNPLLDLAGLPAFDRIRPEHIEPAVTAVLGENRARIAELAAMRAPSFRTLVEPLEEMQHRLARVWSPASHLNAVVNGEAIRTAYNAALPLLSAYHTDLSQSEALYAGYREVERLEGPQLDPARQQVLKHTLREFRLAGVGLDEATKRRFKQVMLDIARLQSKFDENVLDSTNAFRHDVDSRAELDGLNESIIEQARRRAAEAGKSGWTFGLDQPTYVAVVTDAHSRDLRRAIYEAWSTRASDQGPSAGRWDNAPVIEQILQLRHEAAGLLGFTTYADYALATRMARSVAEVVGFLERLAQAARPAALRELAELEAYAGHPLEAWDINYYSEKLQKERYSISQEELRPYFALPRVLEGLFEVAGKLFDVRIRERAGVAVWHDTVRYFEIRDPEDQLVGSFYLDPYARPNKRSGAWMDECVGHKQLAGGAVHPVAYLVCNFLAPGAGRPALLTHDDVITLFHEFGHGLHHLLTRVAYPSLAGINGVAWDAVELPSQFMENYAWEPEVMDRIAIHVGTGEALPAQLREQLGATRRFQSGLQTVRQLEFALFDFRLHAGYDPAKGARVLETLEDVRRETAVIRPPSWNRFPESFGHIFAGGYAAGYYSYKWAEVLAADAFSAFKAQGVFDKHTAGRFKASILETGGTADALEAFVAFRGRAPEIGPLLEQAGIAA